METRKIKKRIIEAGEKAIEELIKIAEEPILSEDGSAMIIEGEEIPINSDDLSADRLKNAAATKKLCIFDAFSILERITGEQALLDGEQASRGDSFGGFAESRASKKKK